MYPYPENVGQKIHLLDTKPEQIKQDFSNTIITIYGLPSTGKGTLALKLAEKLDLPYFETGMLYRAFAFFMKENRFNVVSAEVLGKFSEDLEISLVQEKIQILLETRHLNKDNLRTPEIDIFMGEFTRIPEVRKMVDKIITQFVEVSAFITDGRGAYDGYLINAEKQGFKVIRVLLQAQQNERTRRRFIDYVNQKRNQELNPEIMSDLWKNCEEIVKKRDKEEIERDQKLNLGLISDNSGVLDTTNIDSDQVLNSVLGWIITQRKDI
jgi:CMP/dCMP kinase